MPPSRLRNLCRRHPTAVFVLRCVVLACLLVAVFLLAFLAQCLWAILALLLLLVLPLCPWHRVRQADGAAAEDPYQEESSTSHALREVSAAMEAIASTFADNNDHGMALYEEAAVPPPPLFPPALRRRTAGPSSFSFTVPASASAARSNTFELSNRTPRQPSTRLGTAEPRPHGTHAPVARAASVAPPRNVLLALAAISTMYTITALVLSLLAMHTTALDHVRGENSIGNALLIGVLGVSADPSRLSFSCVFGAVTAVSALLLAFPLRAVPDMPPPDLSRARAPCRVVAAMLTAASAALYPSYDFTLVLVFGHALLVLSFAFTRPSPSTIGASDTVRCAGERSRQMWRLVRTWGPRVAQAGGALLLAACLLSHNPLTQTHHGTGNAADEPGSVLCQKGEWAVRWCVQTHHWPQALWSHSPAAAARGTLSTQELCLRKLFQLLSLTSALAVLLVGLSAPLADATITCGSSRAPHGRRCVFLHGLWCQLRPQAAWPLVLLYLVLGLTVLDAACFAMLCLGLMFLLASSRYRTWHVTATPVLPCLLYTTLMALIAVQYVALHHPGTVGRAMFMSHVVARCKASAQPKHAVTCTAAVRTVVLLVELLAASGLVLVARLSRKPPRLSNGPAASAAHTTRRRSTVEDVEESARNTFTAFHVQPKRRDTTGWVAKRQQIRACLGRLLGQDDAVLRARAAAFSRYARDDGLVTWEGFVGPAGLLEAEWPACGLRDAEEEAALWHVCACSGNCIPVLLPPYHVTAASATEEPSVSRERETDFLTSVASLGDVSVPVARGSNSRSCSRSDTRGESSSRASTTVDTEPDCQDPARRARQDAEPTAAAENDALAEASGADGAPDNTDEHIGGARQQSRQWHDFQRRLGSAVRRHTAHADTDTTTGHGNAADTPAHHARCIDVAALLQQGSPGDGTMSFVDYLIFLDELDRFRAAGISRARVIVRLAYQILLQGLGQVLLLVMFAAAMTVNHLDALNAVYLLFFVARVWADATRAARHARRSQNPVRSGEGSFLVWWRRALVLYASVHVAATTFSIMWQASYGVRATATTTSTNTSNRSQGSESISWLETLGLQSGRNAAQLLSYIVMMFLVKLEAAFSAHYRVAVCDETSHRPPVKMQKLFQALEWGRLMAGAREFLAWVLQQACLLTLGLVLLLLAVAAPRSILTAGLGVLYVPVVALSGSTVTTVPPQPSAVKPPHAPHLLGVRGLALASFTLVLGLYVNAVLLLSALYQVTSVNRAVLRVLRNLGGGLCGHEAPTGDADDRTTTTCALELGIYPQGYLGAATVPVSLLPWYVATLLVGPLCRGAILGLLRPPPKSPGTAVPREGGGTSATGSVTSVRNRSMDGSAAPLTPPCLPRVLASGGSNHSRDGSLESERWDFGKAVLRTRTLAKTLSPWCTSFTPASHHTASSSLGVTHSEPFPSPLDSDVGEPAFFRQSFRTYVSLVLEQQERGGCHASTGRTATSPPNAFLLVCAELRGLFIGPVVPCAVDGLRNVCVALLLLHRLGSHTCLAVLLVWVAQVYACVAQLNVLGACFGLLFLLDGVPRAATQWCRLPLACGDVKGAPLVLLSVACMAVKYVFPFFFVRSVPLHDATLAYVGLGPESARLSTLWPPITTCLAALVYMKTSDPLHDPFDSPRWEKKDWNSRRSSGEAGNAGTQNLEEEERSNGTRQQQQPRQAAPRERGGSHRHPAELPAGTRALPFGPESVLPRPSHSPTRSAAPHSLPTPVPRPLRGGHVRVTLSYLGGGAFMRETAFEQLTLATAVTLALSTDCILGPVLLAYLLLLCLCGRTRLAATTTLRVVMAGLEILLSALAVLAFIGRVGLPDGVAPGVAFLHAAPADGLPPFMHYLGHRLPRHRLVLLLVLLGLHRVVRLRQPAAAAVLPHYCGHTQLHTVLALRSRQLRARRDDPTQTLLPLPTVGYDSTRAPRTVMDLCLAACVTLLPAAILGFVTGVLLTSIAGVVEVVVALCLMGLRRRMAWHSHVVWRADMMFVALVLLVPQLVARLPIASPGFVAAYRGGGALTILGLAAWPSDALLVLQCLTLWLASVQHRICDDLAFADHLSGLVAHSRTAVRRHRRMRHYLTWQSTRCLEKAVAQQAALRECLAELARARNLDITTPAPRPHARAVEGGASSPHTRHSHNRFPDDDTVFVQLSLPSSSLSSFSSSSHLSVYDVDEGTEPIRMSSGSTTAEARPGAIRRAARSLSRCIAHAAARLTTALQARSIDGDRVHRNRERRGGTAHGPFYALLAALNAYARTRTAYVAAVVMLLHFALTGTLLDMVLSLAMLLYALAVLPPAAGGRFWRGVLALSVFSVTAKSLVQVFLLQDDAALQVPDGALIALDVAVVCTGRRADASVNRGIILRDVVLGFVAFVAVLLHREACADFAVEEGVRRCMAVAPDAYGEPHGVPSPSSRRHTVADEEERGGTALHASGSSAPRGSVTSDPAPPRGVLRKLLFNLRHRRGAGADYYTAQFLLDVLGLLLFLWAYFSLTRNGTESRNVLYSVKENRLPGPFVLILLLLVLLLCAERVIYVTHSTRAKIALHVILVVLYHAAFFSWRVATSPALLAAGSRAAARVASSGSTAPAAPAIALFVVKCASLWVGALQLREGYPLHQRHDAFTRRTDLFSWLGFVIFRAIPFLFELRLFLDWSFTRTALKVQQWMLLEDIHYWLYKRHVDMSDLHWTSRVKGRRFPWLVKAYQGILGCAAILAVLFLPLLLYASFGSQRGSNAVVQWHREVTLAGSPATAYASRATVEGLGRSEATALTTALWDVVPAAARQGFGVVGSLQSLRFAECSATAWLATGPAVSGLLQTLARAATTPEQPFLLALTDVVERALAPSGSEGAKVARVTTPYPLPRHAVDALTEVLTAYQSVAAGEEANTDALDREIALPGMLAPLMVNAADSVSPQPYASVNCSMQLQWHRPQTGSGGTPTAAAAAAVYWCFTCAPLIPDVSLATRPNPSHTAPMRLLVSSGEVPALTTMLSFLPNIGIVALYTTFVLAVSSFLRNAVSGDAHRIVLCQVANPEPVAKLLRFLFLVRSAAANVKDIHHRAHEPVGEDEESTQQDTYLRLEQELFLELVDLLRAPGRLSKESGLRVNDYGPDGLFREELYKVSQTPF